VATTVNSARRSLSLPDSGNGVLLASGSRRNAIKPRAKRRKLAADWSLRPAPGRQRA
jgi:hypothetical protein